MSTQTNRWPVGLVALVAACSGHLGMSNLLGTSASDPAGSSAPAAMSSSHTASGDGYVISDPPGASKDDTLITMPKLLQGRTFQWAYRRSPWVALWLADVLGDQLGEGGRMVLVRACLDSDNDFIYAACIGDAHRLDRAKLSSELASPGVPRGLGQGALAEHDKLVHDVKAHDAELAKRMKEDPALVQVFSTIPNAEWKRWDTLAASDADLLSLARKLELSARPNKGFDAKGVSRKPFDGCDRAVAPYLAKVVRTLKQPDANVKIYGSAATPYGYVATLAAYFCASGRGLAIADVFGDELREGLWLRGPRMAITQILETKKLAFDDKAYSLKIPRDANYIFEDADLYGGTGGGHGVVAKVSRDGDVVHLEFSKAAIDYPMCLASERTGSWRYDPNTHELSPVEVCTKWGSEHTLQSVEPIDVRSDETAAIQPGRYVEWIKNSGERPGLGIQAVWDGPKQKKLLALYSITR